MDQSLSSDSESSDDGTRHVLVDDENLTDESEPSEGLGSGDDVVQQRLNAEVCFALRNYLTALLDNFSGYH